LSKPAEPPGEGPIGNLFVVAAPSGGGKTSLVTALLEREPGIRLSVSYTTRPPRPGEIDGVHYRFVDEPRFLARKDAGEFLEHAHVHGNWYATSGTWLAAARAREGAKTRMMLDACCDAIEEQVVRVAPRIPVVQAAADVLGAALDAP
jgi:guanylate kinase